MATVTAIRDALASAVGTISGLRTSSYVPDNPNPPQAIIEPQNINYDSTFGRGMDEFNYIITVLVQRTTSERVGQSLLDEFIGSSGAKSVKRAVELDRTLGGLVQDCRVSGMNSYGSVPIGDNTYLAAEFAVKVYSN